MWRLWQIKSHLGKDFLQLFCFSLDSDADSLVGVATRGGLDGSGRAVFFAPVQTGSETQPSLLFSGYRLSSLWVNRLGRGVDCPHASSTEVKESVEL